jgi:predicted cupin superfamily sugar epimerase
MTADEIIAYLRLRPHPKEGGFFRETYRADEHIAAAALPDRYRGPRALGTAIYYLLTPGTCSALHRLRSDEIFHFHAGDPVEMLQLLPDGSGRTIILGADLAAGMEPQVIVPAGVWQGSSSAGEWTLVGTTMAPPFEWTELHMGDVDELVSKYPKAATRIRALTPMRESSH